MNRLAVAAVALLVPMTAGAFKLLVRNPGPGDATRWVFVSGSITYRHNLAGAPAGIDATGLVDEAFHTWTGVPSANISFVRGTDTGFSGFNFGDDENVISYGDAGDDLETGILAATVIWVPNGTVHGYQMMSFYEITQADIIFNDGVTFTDSNGASLLGGCLGGKFDIEAVALHEVGHLFGLDHPDDMSYAAAIMFPSIADCDATRTSPKVDDVNGVTFLYDSGTPPVYPAFNYDDDEGYAPFTVSFTDVSTGAVTSHSWDFGDGGISNAADPDHEYTDAGTYDVTLTVTNAAGSDTGTRPVHHPYSCAARAPTPGTAPATAFSTTVWRYAL